MYPSYLDNYVISLAAATVKLQEWYAALQFIT